MGADHVVAQLDPAHALEHVGNQQRVAERLAHLLAGRGDPGVVQPVGREAVARRARLGLLVLVVGEAQVDAAAVDVEGGTEVLARHRRALDVPAGAAAAVGRGPRRGGGLGLLGALPQREVARVALAPRVGVAGGLHVVERLPGQLAVRRPRPDVEVDVAGAVLGGVGVALLDQGVDQLEDLGHVAGRGGLVGGAADVDRGEHVVELVVHPLRELVPVEPLLLGLAQDLVVDVGDVADEVDLHPAVLQPAAQHVEVDRRADVADVGLRLHGEAADVDARVAVPDRDEVADVAGRRVVESEGHPPDSRDSGVATPHRRML